MRKKAMETLGKTNKRKSESKDGSFFFFFCATPLVDFLREKSGADREIRQQELEIRKQEQQIQNQQQMNGMPDPCCGSENSR